MKNTTDSGTLRSDLSAPFRIWMILLTVLVLFMVFFTDFFTVPSYPENRGGGFHVTIAPWIEATRITLSNGLDLFSGTPLSPPTDAQRASMLVGLLLALVIGPTLLFLGLRIYYRQRDLTKSGAYGTTLALVLGGVLCYSVAIPSVPVAVSQWQVSQALREANALAEQRDNMIASLGGIVRKAREYRVVSSALGGGNGSFQGFVIPQGMERTDLAVFSLEQALDTLLVLRALPTTGEGQRITATLERSGTLRYRFSEHVKE